MASIASCHPSHVIHLMSSIDHTVTATAGRSALSGWRAFEAHRASRGRGLGAGDNKIIRVPERGDAVASLRPAGASFAAGDSVAALPGRVEIRADARQRR